jgi:hypothetical protein
MLAAAAVVTIIIVAVVMYTLLIHPLPLYNSSPHQVPPHLELIDEH